MTVSKSHLFNTLRQHSIHTLKTTLTSTEQPENIPYFHMNSLFQLGICLRILHRRSIQLAQFELAISNSFLRTDGNENSCDKRNLKWLCCLSLVQGDRNLYNHWINSNWSFIGVILDYSDCSSSFLSELILILFSNKI